MSRVGRRGRNSDQHLVQIFEQADWAGGAGAVGLLGAAGTAARSIERPTNPMADTFLAPGHEPIQRLDAAEVHTWRAFVNRIEEAAGED